MSAARRPKPTDERPLISTSSILILSGFLIGVTVGKIVAEDLSPYVLACGLSGFLAYIALDIAATRREEEAAAEDIRHVHGRLDRHVMSMTPVPGAQSLASRVEEENLPSLEELLAQLPGPGPMEPRKEDSTVGAL
jgi:hypothetical protein